MTIDEHEKSLEKRIRQDNSSMYSEFQQAGFDGNEDDVPSDDISSFLVRHGLHNNSNQMKKLRKIKFASHDSLKPDDDIKSEKSVKISSLDEHKKPYQNAKFRTTIL
jgi:hypothetical protein